MTFSIILASRNRSQLLSNLLASIERTTKDIHNVEVLVGIDDDDAETHHAKMLLTSNYEFVKFFSRPRSHMLNDDYLNWVYNIAGKGKFVIVCNDDAVFRTQCWDEIAMQYLDDYLCDKPDGIVYGFISDNLPNRFGSGYCCFPLLSRRGVKTLGFCMPPEYPSWTADYIIWQLYSTINRVCDLSSIMIEHISYHCGTRARDDISHHVERINNKHPAIHPALFNTRIDTMRQAISAGGNFFVSIL